MAPPAIALLALLAMPGLVLADGDGCNDGGGGGADIHTLSASFDEASGDITVEMLLCAAADTKTKYRVHFDHTAPFAPDSDRDGDGFDDPAGSCITTSDDGMMHRGNKNTGPGEIKVVGPTLTYTVEMSELSSNLAIGDTILVWADTQYKGIIDRAPNTDNSDGCAKPEVEGEYIELALEDPGLGLTLSPGTFLTTIKIALGDIRNYAYDFGATGKTQTFTVTNDTNGTTGTLYTLGCCPAGFVHDNDNCNGQTLAPGATCTFDITYTAPAGCESGQTYASPLDVLQIPTPADHIHMDVRAKCP